MGRIMAIAKNQSSGKSKKGGKKKLVDSFAKKQWYDVIAPQIYSSCKDVGKTPVNRSQGMKLSSDSLLGRIFTVNLAVIDIKGNNALTDFEGMVATRDSIYANFKKWHSAIKVTVDVKTKDGYTLRVSGYTFTKRHGRQEKINTYATAVQKRAIRSIMQNELRNIISNSDLMTVMRRLRTPIFSQLNKACSVIRPVVNSTISKIKVIKRPATMDPKRIVALHGQNVSSGVYANKEGMEGEKNILEVEVKQ